MSSNWMILPLIALGALFVLTIAFSWVFARWWCKPKREIPSKNPANYGLPSENIEFTSHGIRIKGWFIPIASNPAPHPAIILVHGWSRNAAELLPMAGLLNAAGFAVLLFDVRGHGQGADDGPITIRKFEEDILAGLNYLGGRPDVDAHRIGVFGRSIGGSSAILAVATDRRIRALVSCSAFADPEALTKDTLKMFHIPTWPVAWFACRFIERWLRTPMGEITPKNQIGKIEAPILLVHGEADSYIKPDNMETLYALARREQTQRLLVPGRGHSDVMRDAQCRQEIVAFFSRNLSLSDQ